MRCFPTAARTSPANGAVVRRVCDPAVSFATIRDGTSNTLLLGEKQTNPLDFGQSGGDNGRYVNAGADQDYVHQVLTD